MIAVESLVAQPNIDWNLLGSRIFNTDSMFWMALVTTVSIALISQTLGITLGVCLLGATRSSSRILSWSAKIYVLAMRGVPPIVEIFFIYYGANLLLGFDLFPTNIIIGSLNISGALVAGITALAIYEAAYDCEIIRGGLDSIDPGQREAAVAVGMSKPQIMRRILAPQVARIVIPTIGNQFNYMLKATSLLAFVGVYEMFQDAQVGYSSTFRPVEYFIGVAVWYLVLTSSWALVQRRIEKRLSFGTLPPRRSRRKMAVVT